MKHIFNYKLFVESTEIEHMSDKELADAKKKLGEEGYRGFESKPKEEKKAKPKKIKVEKDESEVPPSAKKHVKDKGYRSVGSEGGDTL